MKKKEQKVGYFIGVDWGLSNCGLALADNENRIASGLKEVFQKELIKEIAVLNKEYSIRKIIFGEVKSNKFDKDVLLIKSLGIEIDFENEKFSTLLAQRNLKETQKKKISKNDNVESARIILQAWLDSQK